MSTTCKAEGVILHSLPVKDWDLLITAFTREFGVMKFYHKYGQSRKRNKGAAASPLCCAEFLFRQRESDLASLKEFSIIDMHLDLRKTYEILDYACVWLHLIQKSQLPGKPSPLLYQLLKTYLQNLPCHLNPAALHGSFYLKLLKHEGLIEFKKRCSLCGQPASFQAEEAFCHAHSPHGAVPFDLYEMETLQKLACCRSLKEIEQEPAGKFFLQKIAKLFEILGK